MMRKFVVALSICLCAIGCGGQVPSGPTTYSCPTAVVNGTAYTPLNPSTNSSNPPTTATSYSDATATTGAVWCYIVQSWVSPNASAPSNVAMATAGAGGVALNWDAPVGASGYSYVVSRVAATVVGSPLSPTGLESAGLAQLVKPALLPTYPDAELAYAPKKPTSLSVHSM